MTSMPRPRAIAAAPFRWPPGHDAEGLPRKLGARGVPHHAGREGPRVERQPPRQGEHQEEGQLPHRLRVRAGDVAHGDAAGRGGLAVHVVEPGAELDHQPSGAAPRRSPRR